MDNAGLIEGARIYVAASNAHDLDKISPLFATDPVYRSSGVGEHAGLENIIGMMERFFGSNPDVHWDASDYRLIENRGVEFDFIISLSGNASTGIERLYFDEAGLINVIEVDR